MHDVIINRWILILILLGMACGILWIIFWIRKTGLHFYYNYKSWSLKVKPIEFCPLPFITSDINGKIVASNRGTENMLGWKETEILGKPLTAIIPKQFREAHVKGVKRLRESGHSHILGKTVELKGLKKDHSEFDVALTLWQWNENGDSYYTGIMYDISKQKAELEKYRKLVDLLCHCESILRIGIWKWNVLTNMVELSPGFYKIFDIKEGEYDSGTLMRKVYYEDKPKVEEAITKSFETKEGYELKYRIRGEGAVLKWLHLKAVVGLNDEGDHVYTMGIIQEVEQEC